MTATRVTLMSQHYGISKSDLIAVLDLAASALDGRHAAPGQIHDNCPSCDAAFALGRIRNSVEWTSAPAWRALDGPKSSLPGVLSAIGA